MDGRIKNPWSEEQDQFLKDNFTIMTRKEMAIKLKRSLDSINKRMDRYLKINKTNTIRESMIGRKIGLLTVISYAGRGDKITFYNCKCRCGAERPVRYDVLMSMNINSCGCLRRKNLEKNQYRARYKMYKYAAKKRNLKFKLTFKQFKILISKNCYYCNASPVRIPLTSQEKIDNIPIDRKILVNGIDRKNNSDNYELNRCVPCCAPCNFMKQDIDEEEFLNKINTIYKNKNG